MTIRVLRPLLVACLFCLSISISCKDHAPSLSSPEDLRDSYVQALADNDPDKAYALLSPDVQALTPLSEFRKNWKAHAKERRSTLQAMKSTDNQDKDGLLIGKTWLQGRQLTWRYIDGEFWLVDGLPGLPDTSTPQATLRSLVTALRKIDLRPLEYLFSDSLHEELHGSWKTRADDIEAALNDLNQLELSESQKRAVLHYGANHSITLRRTDGQWQIIRMD